MKISKKITQYRYFIYAFITIILYGQVVGFGTNLDDFLVLEGLPKTGNFIDDLNIIFGSRYSSNEYRPVTLASFVFERHLFSTLSPSISHSINALLFIAIAILLDKLLRKLTKEKFLLAITASILIFLVHPLNVEVVASIKSRDGLLSMLFGLISTILFVGYFNKQRSFISVILGGFILLFALLSKIDAIGFGFFILFLFLFNSTLKTKLKLGGFAVFLFFIFNLIMNIKNSLVNTTGLPDSYVSFTENPMVALPSTFLNHVTFGAQTMCLYFGKLLLPIKLQFYYGFDSIAIQSSASFQAWIFIIINVTILSIAIYFKKKHFVFFLSVFSVYIFLFFASNLINYVAGIMADRYAFLASAWFIFSIAYGINLIIKSPKIKLSIFVFLFISYGVLSFLRIQDWKNFDTLIAADANKIQQSYEGLRIASSHYYNLAIEPNNTKSELQFEKALNFAQKANQLYTENSVMHKQTALIYFRKGDIDAAIKSIEKAMQVSPTDIEIITIAGDLHTKKQDYQRAAEVYKHGHQLYPKHSYFIYQISNSYFLDNQLDACEAFNQTLIENDSTLYEPWENLGYLYLHLKDSTKANSYFDKAKELGLNLEN